MNAQELENVPNAKVVSDLEMAILNVILPHIENS